MSKQIDANYREVERLKKDWVRHQTDMVGIMNSYDETNDLLKQTEHNQTILLQKKLRLENVSQSEKSELKDLSSGMSNMHIDMVKLNDLIAKNAEVQKYLANSNFELENEIIERLKEKEKEARSKESDISELRTTKRDLMSSIVDAE